MSYYSHYISQTSETGSSGIRDLFTGTQIWMADWNSSQGLWSESSDAGYYMYKFCSVVKPPVCSVIKTFFYLNVLPKKLAPTQYSLWS